MIVLGGVIGKYDISDISVKNPKVQYHQPPHTIEPVPSTSHPHNLLL
jgi:hypothetical protein